MNARVVVVGDALIDELRDDRGTREFVGGAALNVAVGLSRLGVDTALIAMVGEDAAGARIRAFLTDFGVELIASPSPLGSSRAVSTRSAGGEPSYAFNEAARARRIRVDDAVRAAIAAAELIVVSCFPFDDAAQTALLAEAVAAVPLVIDPNPRAGMLHDREEFVRGFEALAATAALVKVGDDDADLLYGLPLDALRQRLIGLGADVVLATAGADGATIEAGGDAVARPISRLTGAIVDTMGAGDAVLAATVAGLVGGAPATAEEWGALLTRAMDVAAATCRFEGALLRLPSALEGTDLDRLGT